VTDLWEDEGFGSGAGPDEGTEDDWDEGDESLDTPVEDGFDDPDDLTDEDEDDEAA
jgi:hypothetical protein